MNTDKLKNMAEDFKELISSIKTGESNIEGLKKGLELGREDAKESIKILLSIVRGEEVLYLSDTDKTLIKISIEEEYKNYNKEKHISDLENLFELFKAMDRDLGEPIIIPFVVETIKDSLELVKEINKEAFQVTVEQIALLETK